MLILTIKLPRRRLALAVTTAAFLCCTALIALLPTSQSVPASLLSREDDRLRFLADCGWQVLPEPVSEEELLLPAEFDESYAAYLSLQREQGFSLEDHAGKRVKRYSYEILNHPSGEKGVRANLLVYKKQVIGGEVLSPRPDGFLQGLTNVTKFR